MKQSSQTIILFLFFTLAHINTANSALITPTTDFTTPTLITAYTEIKVDFGVPSSNIDLIDLQFTITFDQNLLDTSESLGIQRLVIHPTLGSAWTQSFSTSLGPPRTTYTGNLDTLFIDNQGIGLFKLGVGGDGAIISDISLIGNATITPVPLPPALLLFLSGLIALFSINKFKN